LLKSVRCVVCTVCKLWWPLTGPLFIFCGPKEFEDEAETVLKLG